MAGGVGGGLTAHRADKEESPITDSYYNSRADLPFAPIINRDSCENYIAPGIVSHIPVHFAVTDIMGIVHKDENEVCNVSCPMGSHMSWNNHQSLRAMKENKTFDATKFLPQSFYARDTLSIARELLGCILVHCEGMNTTVGKIVETEAYTRDDPAAHSFAGKTTRNSVLFGPVGHAYVYFVYGMHFCMNVVTGEMGSGEAVLFRAVEPLAGIDVMKRRRRMDDEKNLCSGPAKLTQAFAITREFNGTPLYSGPLQVRSCRRQMLSVENHEIFQTERIGITKAQEFPYRFYLRENPHISRE